MLDDRLFKITITLGDGEGNVLSTHEFENLAMTAIGTKFTSAISNVCEVRIANIDKDIRDKLLTEGTPYSRLDPPKNSILVEAGRVSTGLTQIFIGDITTVNVTQAPDIWLTLRAITGKFRQNQTIELSQNASTPFSAIATRAAQALGVPLDFQASDKDVTNFSFSGSAEKLVSQLGSIADNVDAYMDDDALTVRPRYETNSNALIEINIDNGLIGIPEFVDLGVRCTVLLRQNVKLADRINLVSAAYPAVDGIYIIYRLGFNLANRDTPFYYIIEASNPALGRAQNGTR